MNFNGDACTPSVEYQTTSSVVILKSFGSAQDVLYIKPDDSDFREWLGTLFLTESVQMDRVRLIPISLASSVSSLNLDEKERAG